MAKRHLLRIFLAISILYSAPPLSPSIKAAASNSQSLFSSQALAEVAVFGKIHLLGEAFEGRRLANQAVLPAIQQAEDDLPPTMVLDLAALEKRMGEPWYSILHEERPPRVLLLDGVVLAEDNFSRGFYSHAPLTREMLVAQLGADEFAHLFPRPTLVLARQVLADPRPTIRQEYMYHVLLWGFVGQYPAIFQQQRLFPENYASGGFEKQTRLKYLSGFKGQGDKPYKGQLGEVLAAIVRGENPDVRAEIKPRITLWERLKALRQPAERAPRFDVLADQSYNAEIRESGRTVTVNLLEAIFEGRYRRRDRRDLQPRFPLRPRLTLRYYTIREAKQMTGFQNASFSYWIRARELPAKKKNEGYQIPREVVRALQDLISLGETAALFGISESGLTKFLQQSPQRQEEWGLIRLYDRTDGVGRGQYVSRRRAALALESWRSEISFSQAWRSLRAHGITIDDRRFMALLERPHELLKTRRLRERFADPLWDSERSRLNLDTFARLVPHLRAWFEEHQRREIQFRLRREEEARRLLVRREGFSVPDLAKRLGLNPAFLYQQIRAGLVAAVDVSRSRITEIRILPGEVRRLKELLAHLRNPNSSLASLDLRKLEPLGRHWVTASWDIAKMAALWPSWSPEMRAEVIEAIGWTVSGRSGLLFQRALGQWFDQPGNDSAWNRWKVLRNMGSLLERLPFGTTDLYQKWDQALVRDYRAIIRERIPKLAGYPTWRKRMAEAGAADRMLSAMTEAAAHLLRRPPTGKPKIPADEKETWVPGAVVVAWDDMPKVGEILSIAHKYNTTTVQFDLIIDVQWRSGGIQQVFMSPRGNGHAPHPSLSLLHTAKAADDLRALFAKSQQGPPSRPLVAPKIWKTAEGMKRAG